MFYVAIHIPEFPIAAWQRGAPSLRAQACIVLAGVPPQEEVASLCTRAKAAGIEHGMSRAQAEAMCAVRFRARQVEEEKAAFTMVAELVECFSPRAEVLASPHNAYAEGRRLAAALLIDASGTGTLFGAPENYARKLYEELNAAGFPASIGAAPSAQAALILARSGQKILCAGYDDMRAKLAKLPVSLLPCEAKMLATLSRWGIRTLGALAALPEAALVSRLGPQGRRLQLLARGEAEHLLVPEEPEFPLSEAVALDSPVELLDSLLFILSSMLEAVLRKARERAYALRAVRVVLQLESGEPHAAEVRPATPAQNRDVLLKLLHLELQARPPAAAIVGVTLNAEPAKPHTAQQGLFQAQFPEPDKLELLLGRLRSIAGENNVGAPKLQNSHREDDFVLLPFRPSHQSKSEREPGPTRLALRAFRPPQPVQVTCSGNRPAAIVWQGTRATVIAAAGPWHASGAWWNEEAWDYDGWDIVTAAPFQTLHLRREQASGRWFVTGLYD